MFLTPDQYAATPVEQLLLEAAKGRLPMDHRLLQHLFDRKNETLDAIVKVGNSPQGDWRFDVSEDLLNVARHLNDPRTIPFLIDLLSEEDPLDEVFDAFAALGNEALEPLLDAYANEDDPEVKGEIAFALAALGLEDSRIEKILQDNHASDAAWELYQQRGEKVEAPFDIFAEYPESGVPLVEALSIEERVELLQSRLEEYRIVAAASLFHEDLISSQVTAIFEIAKTDSSEHVRAHLWQALDNAIDREPIAAEMLARVADISRPDAERCGLLVGLAALADRKEVRDTILAFYKKPETRLKALEAMWRSLDPDFARYFPNHLDDPNTDIRRIALRGVGAQGLTSELGKVRKMLVDEDVREDALFAYAMAAPSKPSLAYLRALHSKIEDEAGGLTEEEDGIVRIALDERLRAHGKEPVFLAEAQNISDED